MFKLVVLSAFVALAVARPGILHNTVDYSSAPVAYSAPLVYSAPVAYSIPTAAVEITKNVHYAAEPVISGYTAQVYKPNLEQFETSVETVKEENEQTQTRTASAEENFENVESVVAYNTAPITYTVPDINQLIHHVPTSISSSSSKVIHSSTILTNPTIAEARAIPTVFQTQPTQSVIQSQRSQIDSASDVSQNQGTQIAGNPVIVEARTIPINAPITFDARAIPSYYQVYTSPAIVQNQPKQIATSRTVVETHASPRTAPETVETRALPSIIQSHAYPAIIQTQLAPLVTAPAVVEGRALPVTSYSVVGHAPVSVSSSSSTVVHGGSAVAAPIRIVNSGIIPFSHY